MKKLIFFIALISFAQNPLSPVFPSATAPFPVASSQASTKTTTALGSGSTTVNVVSVTHFRIGNVATIDAEKVWITNIIGNQFTLTRGYWGSSAVSHTSQSVIQVLIDDNYFNILAAELRAVEDWLPSHSGGGGGIPGGTPGQIEWNSAGIFAGFTMNGDCTLPPSTGTIICTKSNGSTFAASAFTDTTSATNITTGTLPIARLPLVTALGNPGDNVHIPSEAAVRAAIVSAGGGNVSTGVTLTADNLITGAGTSNIKDSGKAFDTDGAMTANSDAKIATQKAVITYVGSHAGGSSDRCSNLIILSSTRATVPSSCVMTIQGITALVPSPSNNYIDFSNPLNTGTIDISFDLPGLWTINHTLTNATCGAGAHCVGSTGAPTSRTAQWVAHFDVSSGVSAPIVKQDVSSLKAYRFLGALQVTDGASGEVVVTNLNEETGISTTSTITETLSSTVCGGTRSYTAGATVTFPTPGTAGFSANCRFSLISEVSTLHILGGGASFHPDTCDTIGPKTSLDFTTDGSNKWYCKPGAGSSSSGSTVTFTKYQTPGSISPVCGASGFMEVWAWSGASSGGGGQFQAGAGGMGGGFGHRIGACTPSATVAGVVGAGGAATASSQGNDGVDSSLTGIITVSGAKWASSTSGNSGYDITNSPDTVSLWYNQYNPITHDSRSYPLVFGAVNFPDGSVYVIPQQEELGGIGTGSVGASTVGPHGNPGLSGGAGGGGGANFASGNHAGGATAKSKYCTSGAGGGIVAGVAQNGSAGGAMGCGGGGGGDDGVTATLGGAGGRGEIWIRTW